MHREYRHYNTPQLGTGIFKTNKHPIQFKLMAANQYTQLISGSRPEALPNNFHILQDSVDDLVMASAINIKKPFALLMWNELLLPGPVPPRSPVSCKTTCRRLGLYFHKYKGTFCLYCPHMSSCLMQCFDFSLHFTNVFIIVILDPHFPLVTFRGISLVLSVM